MRRRSVKDLDLDEGFRQQIISGSTDHQQQVLAGDRRGVGPYGRAGPRTAVDRLLRNPRREATDNDENEEGLFGSRGMLGSPLRSVFGRLTGKIQDLMKGIFAGADEAPRADEEINQVDIIEDRRSRSISRSLSGAQLPTVENETEEDSTEARRTAYSELAAFFESKKGQSLSASDISRTLQLVSPARSTVAGAAVRTTGKVLMTPLPRRQAATLSKMPSAMSVASNASARIVPASTQLKFRTRPVARVLPVVEEKPLLESDVQAELDRSYAGAHVETQGEFKTDAEAPVVLASSPQGSPMKVSKHEEEPAPKRICPNRFTGVFYLDPDEEEQELLEDEKRAAERQKRIDELLARKEQRERVVSFRQAPPKEQEIKGQTIKEDSKVEAKAEEKPKPLFDFSEPAATSATKPEVTPAVFELPSATTKLTKADEDREERRKRPGKSVTFALGGESETSKGVSFNFVPPTLSTPGTAEVETAKPVVSFNFAPPIARRGSVEKPIFSLKPATEQPAEDSKPVFTFGSAPLKAEEVKETPVVGSPAVISFGGDASAKEETSKPLFSFAAKTESAPATAPLFVPPTALVEVTEKKDVGESKPAAPLFSFAMSTASKPEENKAPLISFGGVAPKTDDVTSATPIVQFTFGAAPPTTSASAAEPPAKSPSFTFGDSTKLQFSFGDKSTSPPAPQFYFGKTTPEATTVAPALSASSQISFGGTKAAESVAPFQFGSSSTKPAEPVAPFQFGGSSSSTKPTEPAVPFQFGTSSAKPAVAPFQFGSTTTSAGPVKPFVFGSAPASTTVTPAATPVATPSFGFNFGSTQQPAAASSFDSGSDMMMEDSNGPASAPAASPFVGANFSAFNPAPSPAPSTPTFGFAPSPGPAQPSSSVPFVFGQQPPAQQQQSNPMDTLAAAAAAAGNSTGFTFNAGTSSTVAGRKTSAPVSRLRRR